MPFTVSPITDKGTVVLTRPCTITATLPSALAEGVTVTLLLDGDTTLSLPMVVDTGRIVLSLTLTVAQVAAVATVATMVRVQIVAGSGDALVPLFVGHLAKVDKWTGQKLPGLAVSAGATEAAVARVASLAAQAAAAASEAAAADAIEAAASVPSAASLSSTYVTFKRSDNGEPITGGHIAVKVDPATHEITDIVWEA